MLEDNSKTSRDIAGLNREIERQKFQKMKWTLKIEQNEREFSQRNNDLEAEKRKIYKHYKELKGKMAAQRDEKEKQLGTIAMNSLKCMETLKEY